MWRMRTNVQSEDQAHKKRAAAAIRHPPLVALALVAAITPSGETPRVPSRRPNILFVIADDWSHPHAGAYGDRTVRTPAFDRIAREGALFTNSFTVSPSCTPSRAAILTGQAVHRLAEGGNLQGFLSKRREGQPFCFWLGTSDPHRPYEPGSGARAGLRADTVAVPAFLPDTPEVRGDLLDYYLEVQRFDEQLAGLIETLERRRELDSTLLVVTSDNGMPFPRAKANVYDAGSRMPLAIRWPDRVNPGTRIDPFVSHQDLAPTFLEVAGLPVPEAV